MSVLIQKQNIIIGEIEKLADHASVKDILEKPNVPIFFVRILHLMLISVTDPSPRTSCYIQAATLLKMGLDAHDDISDDVSSRDSQLIVLSGDYYSSLFYRLLIKNNELHGVKRLSAAAVTICEAKAQIHLSKLWDLKNLYLLQKMVTVIPLTLLEIFKSHPDQFLLWSELISAIFMLHKMSSCSLTITSEGTSYLKKLHENIQQKLPKIDPISVQQGLEKLLRDNNILMQEVEME